MAMTDYSLKDTTTLIQEAYQHNIPDPENKTRAALIQSLSLFHKPNTVLHGQVHVKTLKTLRYRDEPYYSLVLHTQQPQKPLYNIIIPRNVGQNLIEPLKQHETLNITVTLRTSLNPIMYMAEHISHSICTGE